MYQKLKKYFVLGFEEEISQKTIHDYGEELWIIDETTHDWFFIVNSNGNLFYNQTYFKKYRDLFSFEVNKIQTILREWFEENFEIRLRNVSRKQGNMKYMVESILGKKNKKMDLDLTNRWGYTYGFVKKFKQIKNYNGMVSVGDFLN